MRELTAIELTNVSGATLGDALYSAVLGGFSGMGGGSIIGGVHGGNGGGLLGVGSIGQGVGMLWGAALGGVVGATLGGVYGYNHKQEVESIVTSFFNSVINGSFYPGVSTNTHI